MLLVLSAVLVKVGAAADVRGRRPAQRGRRSSGPRDRPLRAQRGSIFDRNGEELALSVPASTVAVNPKQVERPGGHGRDVRRRARPRRRAARRAGRGDGRQGPRLRLRRPPGRRRRRRADRRPRAARRDDLPRGPARCCPAATPARSVIGRTDIDGVGTPASRSSTTTCSTGKPRRDDAARSPRAAARSPAASRWSSEPVPGNDIVLTLDRSVQYAAEQALLKRVAELGARGGQAIVMGRRPARSSPWPRCASTTSGVYEITSGNYSAVDAYEPGSVGKVITISGALNEGTVTPETVVRRAVAEGVHERRRPPARLARSTATRLMSVEQILVESSNIGTITVSGDDGLRAAVRLHAGVRPRREDGAQLPRREARHPQPVAGRGRAPRSTPSPTARASPAARSS